ncbi:hypothetical protein RFI_25880 [Reticulomyxa filosa]|uniref:Uncharacterized protein n=1 Tax=Reticulomyxa filosa TaxID=46433 RepID=X6MCW4_RETFI|nr:hypothetical protein RFI_25880 [Reticulomyxa filosa]|eukprot:ETO11496.1 hypothetical protein RFI_25880 [Reticulomyxa filosa]
MVQKSKWVSNVQFSPDDQFLLIKVNKKIIGHSETTTLLHFVVMHCIYFFLVNNIIILINYHNFFKKKPLNYLLSINMKQMEHLNIYRFIKTCFCAKKNNWHNIFAKTQISLLNQYVNKKHLQEWLL